MLKVKVFNYQTGEIHPIDLTPETNSKGQCTIGRALNCDLVLVSPEVSRIHARIIYQNGDYYFTDLCSKIGSRINNEDVQANQSYILSKNDVIRVGGFVILIESVETSSLTNHYPGWVQDSDRHWTKDELIVRCVGVVDETTDIKTFSFAAESSVPLTYKPGQFITLELEISGEPILGSYFISSTPSRPHSLEITVKRIGQATDSRNRQLALVSNWLHDRITIGSTVKLIGGAMGDFTCVDKPSQKLLMISSGNGIIPIMSMTRWVSDTLSAESDLIFFHSTRSPRDIIFRRELELIAARMPKFRLAMTMTQPEPGDVWMGLTGRVTEAMLQAIAPDFQERTVYICGPDSFLQAVKAMLEALAFPMENYYEERLTAPKKGQNALKTSKKESPLLPPSDRFQNGFRGSEEPTVIRFPYQGTPEDEATVIPFNCGTPEDEATVIPFNRGTPQDAPTKIKPSSQGIVQNTPRSPQSSKQVTAIYEKSVEATVKHRNGAQTAVEELSIPLNELFPETSGYAPKLVSNSPFSTGLPALYIIGFLSGLSMGLFSPFISTLMSQHQVPEMLIGANSTLYYLAITLGTPVVAKMLPRIGLRRTMMFGLALMGLTAPLFTMTTEISLWFVIRAVMGIACSLYFVSGQTGLNHFCRESNRAIANGLYALTFSLGFGIGPAIASVFYKFSPTLAFSLGSLLIFSGIAVVLIGIPETVVVFQPSSRTGIFKRLSVPLLGAFAFGFAESVLVSLYPVYLLQQNYSVDRIGYTFSIFVIGGLLATIPITHFADRFGKINILLISVCVVILSILSLSLTQDLVVVQLLTFITGASLTPIFPLSLALIGEKLSRDELSSGSALFTAIYSIGCTAGPLLSSIIMKMFGDRFIFSLLLISLTIFLERIMRQPKKVLLTSHAG
ncbi:MFS transporter [Scytonema sp. UIC 10036]|uniref:MFS transporter n=1 Tax=Scytonema sp. UIC 10036 TaxID=2304196 RepID=UPI0012DA68EB|nr:MFS transporter [Scytonema sp. UIC 10036]MUH01250.1 MFS transporter [Scytonema sp. UIC 10036]